MILWGKKTLTFTIPIYSTTVLYDTVLHDYIRSYTAFRGVYYFSSKKMMQWLFNIDHNSLLTNDGYTLIFTIDCGLTHLYQLFEVQCLTKLIWYMLKINKQTIWNTKTHMYVHALKISRNVAIENLHASHTYFQFLLMLV